MTAGTLGRLAPPDWEHVEKYPLTASTAPAKPAPMVIGVNWYSAFDTPTREGNHFWIARNGSLGRVRGGHCVALKHRGATDLTSWYDFYNQGQEGACVGFGCSRLQSLNNRKTYFARWLWDHAKATDEWPETNPGDQDGTSVRAALEIMRTLGHVPWSAKYKDLNSEGNGPFVAKRDAIPAKASEGIAAYRWATSADDALAALGYSDVGYVDVINSWGRSYPHLVRMPAEVLQRLLNEDGEIAIVTDR
jgi:hypothetical protein